MPLLWFPGDDFWQIYCILQNIRTTNHILVSWMVNKHFGLADERLNKLRVFKQFHAGNYNPLTCAFRFGKPNPDKSS